MPHHLCLFLWIALSLCAKGDTKVEVEGRNVGDRCKLDCGGMNLFCNATTKLCQCRRGFDIEIRSGVDSSSTLCLAPAKLGEECYHDLSCLPSDKNSECLQTHHRAECGCRAEYHKILDKSSGNVKCVSEREATSNTDLATFIGVGVGMTLFCGLTCLVLRIFARARFGPRRHHYANAHLAPPITLSAEQGEAGNNSRQSSQRSSIGGSRRQSMLAPPSRPGEGSRRASNSSIRSSVSARSYSLKNHQHRTSEPDAYLNPNKLPTDQVSSANVSPSTHNPQNRSPHKGSRSSSTGALTLATKFN